MFKLPKMLLLLVLMGSIATSQVQRSGPAMSAPVFGNPGSAIGSLDELKPFTAGGHILGFRKGEMFVASGDHALRVEFVNARPVSPGEEAKSGDPESNHQTAQPLGKVSYPNLWDGVTLVYENHGSGVVKSTYRVEPVGSSVSSPLNQIRLRYNVPVKVDDSGSLVFSFPTGEMRDSRPVAWQEIEGNRVPVEATYRLISEQEVGFKTGSYDSRYQLVIDPVLSWNTFLGSSADADHGYSIAVDTSGNVYVTGWSWATWGSPIRPHSGSADAFVAKLDGNGALLWNTFLGGSAVERGYAIVVDGSGNIYVTGESEWAWGSPIRPYTGGSSDAFVAKISFISPRIVDFNGDGKEDILWRNYGSGQNAVWYLGSPTGVGQVAQNIEQAKMNAFGHDAISGNVFWSAADVGSSSNAKAEVVKFDPQGGSGLETWDALQAKGPVSSNAARAFSGMAGNGPKALHLPMTGYAMLDTILDVNWNIVGTGDFDGDSEMDILWRNNSTGQNAVWLMNGINYSGNIVFLNTVSDPFWQIVGTGDFSGDGKVDILWRNLTTGQNAIWFMYGTTYWFSNMLNPVADGNWLIMGVGDFNGDYMPDIIWRNVLTGQNAVWYLNGSAYLGYDLMDPVAYYLWLICNR